MGAPRMGMFKQVAPQTMCFYHFQISLMGQSPLDGR